MHKIGNYYEQIGLSENEYYQEEFSLLLELAKECREQYFYQDHEEYIKQIENILPHNKNGSQELLVKYYSELAYKFIDKDDLQEAQKQLAFTLR